MLPLPVSFFVGRIVRLGLGLRELGLLEQVPEVEGCLGAALVRGMQDALDQMVGGHAPVEHEGDVWWRGHRRLLADRCHRPVITWAMMRGNGPVLGARVDAVEHP